MPGKALIVWALVLLCLLAIGSWPRLWHNIGVELPTRINANPLVDCRRPRDMWVVLLAIPIATIASHRLAYQLAATSEFTTERRNKPMGAIHSLAAPFTSLF